jgi:uncharacterized membrane protein HdeD (DUF308 family)
MLSLARNWWLVAVRGLLLVIIGFLALIWPGVTLAVLVVWVGAALLVTGILALVAALVGRDLEGRGSMVLVGILGVAAGLITFFSPGLTTFARRVVVATWAFIIGIAEIATAVRFRKVIRGEWFLGVAGVLSILFGVLLFARPLAGLLALAILFGWFAIFYGVSLTALGFRLRSWQKRLEHAFEAAPARA